MFEVTLRGVRKSFDDHPIIQGVDLEVQKGEFLVMLGPSGCGKTTLLRLIAGLERLDAGTIAIGGRVVNDVPPRDRDVAMVFQSYALYPHMSVRENMAFGLRLRKLPQEEIARRVAEAAGLLELTTMLARLPKALSGGQRQRVAMGRAIVRHPQVFLFDEPLSNLDTALRIQMRGELARLHRRLGATMVYVTHDQVEAMTLASRVAVFHEGLLQQLGRPLELYHRPVNRFVAGFLGSPAMNFLRVRQEGGVLSGRGVSLTAPSDLPADAGCELLIGLRPQELQVDAGGFIRGEVEAVERMGFDGYAFLATEAGKVTARFDKGVEVSVGDRVGISCVSDALHVFAKDGRALRHPALPEGLR